MPTTRNKRTKRTRRRKTIRQSSGAEAAPDQWDAAAILEFFSIIRAVALAMVVMFIGMVVAVAYYIPAMESDPIKKSHPDAQFIFGNVAGAVTLSMFVLALRARQFNVKVRQERMRALKYARWLVLLSILSLTLIILPSLYLLGFTEAIIAFVNTHFPNLGKKTGEAISYMLTILFSGVCGNFAYDLLKRLASRLIRSRYSERDLKGAEGKRR
jgi:hypothetical protein